MTPARPCSPRILAFLTAFLGCGFLPLASSSLAQEQRPPSNGPAFVQRPESELLLLSLRLSQTILVDGMPAYPVAGGVVVPLGAVCEALDFAITVDVSAGAANGFFITEDRRFSLDMASQRVTVEGKTRRFDPLRIEVHQDNIYVDTQLLSDWFPFDATVDFSALLLTLRPREPLPVQKRQEREQRAKKDLSSLGLGGAHYPSIGNPYRLFDVPFIDQTLRGTLTTGASGTRSVQYSTLATGDFLYHEASAYISGDQTGVSDYRIALGRRDPAGGLLGPLRAREYVAGDVLYPGLGSISLPHSGPGFLLSNFPLQRQSQFDRNTFRGDLPLGWEVELYQNGALIGFQQSRADGLYQFDNVPLIFGLNAFRLVFYGPQGQRREELSRFNLAESLTPAGQVSYRIVGNDPKDATPRGQIDLDFGLSRQFSASADLVSVEIERVQHTYSRAALRGYSSLLFANAELIVDYKGGWAAGATLQTRIGAIGLNLQYMNLQNGFISEVFRPQYGLIRSRGGVHLDATIPAGLLPSIPATIDFTEDKLVSGQAVEHLTGRLSTFYRGLSVSNFIDWTFPRGEPRPLEPIALGDLLVSKFVRNYGIRGELLYDLAPRAQITSAALTVERAFPSYLVQAGVSRAVLARQTHLLASVTRSDGPFGFGVILDYARPGILTAALTLNVSLARDPRSGKWLTRARSLAGLGAASPSVFLDSNGNGVRDAGEKPMEGVGFSVNRALTETRTSAEGATLVTNLAPYQEVDVAVAESTLEDPLAVSERPGVRFVPRPGHVTLVDFPVLISGEVTGTARLLRDGKTQEAAGVIVQLVDAGGAVAREARTAYDGFYDITSIVPGDYDVRVSPQQVERLKLKAPAPRRVTIAPTGTILDGIDLLLEAVAERPGSVP